MSSAPSSTFPRLILSFEMKFLYFFFFFLVSLLLNATFIIFFVAILTHSELFLLCAADFLISCISEIPPVALFLTVKSFRAGPTFVSRSSIPNAVLGMEEVLNSRWRSVARKVEKVL